MAGISKRIRGSWVSSNYGIMKTATDTITTLPADIYANDTTATVGLKGNTVQSATPTPQNPIMPQGTGERTGNLAPPLSEWVDGYINSSGTISTAGSDTKEKTSDYIELLDEQVITFSYPDGFPHTTATNAWRVIAFYKSDKTFLTRIGGAGDITALTASVPENAKYARLSMRNYGWTGNTMLNSGSEALPYEPYGYKIPISSANTTTPVYLGEVETTRKIKKVVFTGSETWNGDSLDNKMRYYPTPVIANGVPLTEALSTHFAFGGFNANSGANGTITGTQSSGAYRIYFWSSDYVTVEAWKTYLAQQYAAGTPVCIWYVLATEETGVVNEPIRKIGEYVDEVSGISIPVTAGGDIISVDTTLQPSEVTATYKGWHPAIVHERTNGTWT